ncbi:MAG: hypothetical protein PUG15_00740 [Bacteroidales bacterium]|nr:hypothetical protein [Bacteroidales bacterium]
MAEISINNLMSQSPYLYLQGAGSDGTDGSASGVHLRWDFGEELAEKHIPKGNLAAENGAYYTTAGFNKANDFVKIYRTRYNRNFPIIIDFASMSPSQIIDSAGQLKTWRYDNLTATPNLPNNTCNVLVRFPNTLLYNQAKQLHNPATERVNFLKAYTDVIEVEVENRLMFSAYVQMQVTDEAQENMARIESISCNAKEVDGERELFVSNRKRYGAGSSLLLKEDLDFLLQENGGFLEVEGLSIDEGRIMGENIKYIRFRGDNCFPALLWLETYQDFLLGKNYSSDWELKAELSLSINDNEVFDRLEKTADYQINNAWPKYVNGAKVNVSNYRTRWTGGAEEGLRDGVIHYLNLSRSADNLEACNQPNGETPDEGEYVEEFGYSYLSFLKLVAFDYHIARMLGFGYIDTDISGLTDKYIYIAVYETTAALDNQPAALRTHTFMTLPVGKTDYKLPAVPVLEPLQYGLSVDDGAELPVTLTDGNGYGKYDNSRAIGLCVKPFETMSESVGRFFFPDNEFCYTDYTEPILFGIAYKRSQDSNWCSPEINNDPEFADTNGQNESVAVIRPDTDSHRIFTHYETEDGVHDYAVYGINWFSRVSPLSNVRQTDYTVFPIKNTLVPPLNLGVQLIQREDPLIFTTAAEQSRLNSLPAGDKTLVRLTFEWNDINASNYWYGKEAEFFFRTEPLSVIKGKIKSVTDLGAGIYEIHTIPYTIYSVSQTYIPLVPQGRESRFFGSFLVTNENDTQYEVQEIRQSGIAGEGSIFRVKSLEDRALVEGDDNLQHIVNAPHPPKVGDTFSVSENASLTVGWPVQLTQKVSLVKFSDYTESYTDNERNTTQTHIGGIFEKASITEFLDVDNEGDEIQGSRTGIYRIVFDTYILQPHGNPNVEWYKGTVRVRDNHDEIRVLEVWSIEENTATLQLIVHDALFNVDENYMPQEGYEPIPIGANIDINYHPGYRVYLTHETGFDELSLLPEAGAGSKQSLIACRSTDPILGIASPLSTPGVLLAREIVEPVQPERPEGALFATRPNFYGKATYTFDTKVVTDGGREPYAMLFYRADEQIILDALYKHETVLQIRSDLAQIENDIAFTSRWNELVNVELDASGRFKEWNGYRFPNPDNEAFRIPNPNPQKYPVVFNGFSSLTNPGSDTPVQGTDKLFGTDTNKTYKDIVKLAINNVFLPLTEQPVIYRYIKNGYQTSDRKPTIKDSDGNLIMPGSGSYDGSPMAVKFVANGRSVVRFTDYTLDGASNSFFFYYAKEMSNMLSVSERSEIMGPVQLINTLPPKAPEIKKFYVRTENAVTGDTTAVLFEINDYQTVENVNKILIYRALNSIDAMTVRTMQLAATIDVNDPIVDDFSDLNYYPFGKVLYYRLVAVREVRTKMIDADNGIYETETTPSCASSLVLANIIDVNNPLSPELSYTASDESTEDLLENVVISWEPTAYNGTYRLFQMNDSGNWTELYCEKNEYSSMQYALPYNLPKTDEDGGSVFYRFKVTVESSSGLLSVEENILTI